MEHVIPFYFQNKHNTLVLIFTTMLFVGLFFLIFSPFQSRSWVNNDWQFLAYSLLVAIVAGIVLAISRINLYHYNKRHELHYVLYAVWIGVEVVVLTLTYTLGVIFLFPKFANEYQLTFFHLFKDIFFGSAFILLIPYTSVFLFLQWQYSDNQYELLKYSLEEKIIRDERISFFDERGELKFAIKPQMIYYIKAADNYVEIFYCTHNKLEKMLLRNSLKNVAFNVGNSSLIRCHRSYIVNVEHVDVMKKAKGETILEMTDALIPPIPVSANYANDVMKKITNNG